MRRTQCKRDNFKRVVQININSKKKMLRLAILFHKAMKKMKEIKCLILPAHRLRDANHKRTTKSENTEKKSIMNIISGQKVIMVVIF